MPGQPRGCRRASEAAGAGGGAGPWPGPGFLLRPESPWRFGHGAWAWLALLCPGLSGEGALAVGAPGGPETWQTCTRLGVVGSVGE